MDKNKAYHRARDVADDMESLLCSNKYERIMYHIIYKHTLPWWNKKFIATDYDFVKEKSSLCCHELLPCREKLYPTRNSLVKKGIIILLGDKARGKGREYVLNLPKIMRLARKLYLMLDSPQGEHEAGSIKKALSLVEEDFNQREIPNVKLEMRMPTVDDVLKKKVGVKVKKKKKPVKDEFSGLKLVASNKSCISPRNFEKYLLTQANRWGVYVPTKLYDMEFPPGEYPKEVIDSKLFGIIGRFLRDHGENSKRMIDIIIENCHNLKRAWAMQHGLDSDEVDLWFDWYWYHEYRDWVVNEINDRPIYHFEERYDGETEKFGIYRAACVPVDSNKRSVEKRKKLCKEPHSMARTGKTKLP